MEKLLHHGITSCKGFICRYVCVHCLNRGILRNQYRASHVFQNESGLKTSNLQKVNIHGFPREPKIDQLKNWKIFRKEFIAFSKLLHRSGYHDASDICKLLYNQHRHFSTSRPRCNKNDKDDDEDEQKKKDDFENKMAPILFLVFLSFMTLLMLSMSRQWNNEVEHDHIISWNTFQYGMLAKGEVKSIVVNPEAEMAIIELHPGAVLNDRKVPFKKYFLKLGDANKFEEKVRNLEQEMGISIEHAVPITFRNPWPVAQIVGLTLALLTVVFLVRLTKSSFSGMDILSEVNKAKFTRVDIASNSPGKRITFKDVAGLKEAKIEVMEFVDYLKNPQRYKDLGGKIPKGALLLGPPGCGKTLLAKAVAAEAKVPFLAMAGSEFIEMIGGLGASRVRDLFEQARKKAPCIIYIDEIDAIGRMRGGGNDFSSGEEEQTLNQLLVELDGMGTTEGVIMLASTNRAEVLDKALLRPGRFDRHITIDLPTLIERLETFEMYLQKLKLTDTISAYAPRLAQMTPGMSGADIANVCNESALYAARNSRKSIGAEDFDYAVERVIAGVAKKSGLLSPTERKVVAYHESGHAIVGWMLKHTDALLRISIVPRTNNALGFAQYVPSDQKLYSTEELFERMCMALGGRAAEAIIFNRITTGAQDDLKRVTKLAYQQIKSFGMNETIGHLSFPDEGDGFGSKPYSKKLGAVIDEEARALVGKAYRHTEKVLQENKDKLQKLAEALIEKEVITYDEVENLIGAPPHGKKNVIDPVWIPGFNTNESAKSNNKNNDNKSAT